MGLDVNTSDNLSKDFLLLTTFMWNYKLWDRCKCHFESTKALEGIYLMTSLWHYNLVGFHSLLYFSKLVCLLRKDPCTLLIKRESTHSRYQILHEGCLISHSYGILHQVHFLKRVKCFDKWFYQRLFPSKVHQIL